MLYSVRPGDTLWGIAERFLGDGSKWPQIARANGLKQPDSLFIGQVLLIPQPQPGAESWLRQIQAQQSLPMQTPLVRDFGAPPEKTPATQIPVRGLFFTVADEFLPSAKVVRKVIVNNQHNAAFITKNPELAMRLMNPERYGMSPKVPGSSVSMGRHAIGMTNSNFLSASTFPSGAPRFDGKPYWIDVRKAEAAGATIHSSEEILADLDRIAKKTKDPGLLAKIDKTRGLVRGDAEVLIEGSVPAGAIKSQNMMRFTKGMRVVQGVGMVLTVYDLGQAGKQSYEQGSVKPIAAEGVRQVGGWAAGLAGAKVGAAVGAALGIETGPGALITGAVGGLIGGALGYFGSDWVADQIHEN